MKRLAGAAIFLLVLFVLSASSRAAAGNDFETIREHADAYLSGMPDNGYYFSADDLMKRIESGRKDFVLVDVRDTAKKYKSGHIPGAVYINYREMAKPESLAKLPRDKDILLYCNSGHEESKVMTVLRMLGYRAFALKFGYIAWKKEKPTDKVLGIIDNAAKKNYPVEKE